MRRLSYQRMTVCASPDYVGRCGRPESIADLAGCDAVVYRRDDQVANWIFPRDDGSREEIAPRSRLWLDDLKAIKAAVVDGFGIGWLPCWLIHEDLAAGRLVQLVELKHRFEIPMHAIWAATPHLPTKVRLAIDMLAERLPILSRSHLASSADACA